MQDGTPFGRYRLIELLGRGGMGEVWRAYDTVTDRVVALKVLPTQMAQDPDYEARFRREARAAAGLNNPHIVPIHDYGDIDGRLFVTMRLIDGRDLAATIARGPLPPAQAVNIIDQIAGALHAAHRNQLIHRDVKPSNILLDEDDNAYLIDFGIARAATDTKMTNTGMTIGTWAYMSPERFTTGQTDPSVDTYALACVLHETLTGTTPYPGDSIEQIAAGHMFTPPPRPSLMQPGLPPQLDDVIATGMAKNPADRYPTVRDLARAAQSALAGTAPAAAPTVAAPTVAAPGPISPTDPTQQRTLPQSPNSLSPSTSRKRRTLALWAFGALVVIVAVGAAFVIPDSGDHPEAVPKPTERVDTKAFTGRFTAAFGPTLAADGSPGSTVPTEFTDTFRIRAACRTEGCIATASVEGQYASKSLIFDDIDGSWVAVSTSRRPCQTVDDDEAWNVISVQPRPDGTFSGEMTQNTSAGCFNRRTVTFNRTGVTDVSLLPDPAEQAPRVVSPAAGFQGRYHTVATYANGGIAESDLIVETHCLRDGMRCISHTVEPGTQNQSTYVFDDGGWTRNDEFDTACSAGGTSHIKWTSTLELPQPPEDPITRLMGHGYSESTGTTCTSQSLDEKFTRIGD
jgi:serine/threonine protein kinase